MTERIPKKGLILAIICLAQFMVILDVSILAVTFAEGRERNWALGIFGAVGGSSATVGVIASGLLTDGPGWRWVFFINVPVGLLLIGLAAAFLAADRPEGRTARLDVAGATAVTGGLLLLVYALNRGADYGWTSGTTLMLFAAAALLLAAFVRIEVRSPAPLVPAVALRNRTLVAANLSAFFTFSAMFSFIFLGSLLMQQVLGYSPTKTGLSWLTTSATAFVASAVAGAAGVAAVSTVLVSQTGLSGFRAAFVVISVAAALGALAAAAGFQRHARPAEEPALDTHPRPGDEPLMPIPVPVDQHLEA